MKITNLFLIYLLPIISPTHLITYLVKGEEKNTYKKIKGQRIKSLVNTYLGLSCLLFSLLLFWPYWSENLPLLSRIIFLIIIYFSISRVIEIFISFLLDSMDKLKNKPLEEDLKYSDRCIITLKSYLEIILNYGIIYYGLSTRYAQNIFSSKEPLISPRLDNVFEGVYFSINTISILGYGDIQPNHFSSQFFSSLEVLSGVFLFIVSFATYLTLNFTPVSNLKTKKKIKSAKIDKQLLLLQISIIFFIIIREVIEISRWL